MMASAARQPLEPDRDATRTYLADYFQQDIHLVSILPDGTPQDVRGQYFGADHARAEAWAYQENQRGWNVYTTVNIVERGLNKKPKGTHDKTDPANMGDMAGHRFVHVDWDPPKAKGSVWSVEDCRRQLAALRYPPSFILFTGGGVAPFWRLDETVIDRVAVERVNRALAQKFGGDHCHNHDRLMRLPGTINIPDLTKRARGRTEALACVLEPDDGVVYPLHALAAEYQLTEGAGGGDRVGVNVGEVVLLTADDLKLTTLHPLRTLIDQPKGEDRSRDAYKCAGYMVRYRYSDAQILGVLLNPLNAVSEHCLSQPAGKERRAAERCIEGTRAELKQQAEGKGVEGKIALTDFYAYMPMHNYIYVPTRETWPGGSVNSRLPQELCRNLGDEAIRRRGLIGRR